MQFKLIKIQVNNIDNAIRIDKFIASNLKDLSRNFILKLIKSKKVKLNKIIITSQKFLVKKGVSIAIEIPIKNPDDDVIIPEEFTFDILYEDKDLLVINKPAGVVVHPANGHHKGTVVNALLGKYKNFVSTFYEKNKNYNLLELQRPGIVHRIDKETSGCLIIAKNITTKSKLSEDFSLGKIYKEYEAITCGISKNQTGKIITLIGRHPINRQKMAVLTNRGKKAITLYNVIKIGKINEYPVSFLTVNILTGRTHQIRVHLSYMKMPILGDKIYKGNKKLFAPRQMLHAKKINFLHPISGKNINVTSPYPDDFKNFCNLF